MRSLRASRQPNKATPAKRHVSKAVKRRRRRSWVDGLSRMSAATSSDGALRPASPVALADVGVVALSIWTLGLPATLLLVGIWQLASGLALFAPELEGVASWAAAVVAEVSILGATTGVTGLLSLQLRTRWPNIIILLIPAVLGLLLRLKSAGLRSLRSRAPSVPRVLGSLAIVVLLGADRWLAALGTDYGIAWAMSGDARNEVLVIRSIIRAGGVSVRELRAFPALIEGVMAQVTLAGGRAHLAPGTLMIHDASTIAAFYVLACIGIAVMTMASLLETWHNGASPAWRDLGPGRVLVLVGAAAMSFTPLVLGTSLDEGFVVAYVTIPILMSCVILALRYFRRPSPLPIVLVAIATVVILFSWSVVAVIPAVLDIIMIIVGWHRQRYGAWAWRVSFAFGGAMVVLLIVIGISQESRLRAAMAGTGAIVPPNSLVGPILCLVAIALWAHARNRTARLQFGAVAVCAVITEVIIWGIGTLGSPPHGVYYSMKTLWVLASAVLWLAFVPAFSYASPGEQRAEQLKGLVKGSAWVAVVTMLVSMTTSADDPLTLARAGWFEPSAPVVAEVAAAGNKYKHFVFWDWAQNSADDRLANFWADLVWGTISKGWTVPYLASVAYRPYLPGGLYLWAYSEDSDQLPVSQGMVQLCAVVRSVPGIVVITRTAQVKKELKTYCTGQGAAVVIAPNWPKDAVTGVG